MMRHRPLDEAMPATKQQVEVVPPEGATISRDGLHKEVLPEGARNARERLHEGPPAAAGERVETQ
eukprot:12906157-Prorocentrum_lima.AAC.1